MGLESIMYLKGELVKYISWSDMIIILMDINRKLQFSEYESLYPSGRGNLLCFESPLVATQDSPLC